MGAWGTGVFDNDSACDWAYELEEQHDLAFVERTLDKVLAAGGGDLDAADAEEGLAAVEVIARLQGSWGVRNSYTETVDSWVETSRIRPSPALVAKAYAVVDRILVEPSEILEAWNDVELLQEWRQGVVELKARIQL